MEQLNRKTKEEKTMPIFTTNRYLYKTYLHPISAKSQKKDTTTATDASESKMSPIPKTNVNKKIVDFEELLQEAIDDPYAAYADIPFNVISYKECDTWARLMVRVDEVMESLDIIEYALSHLPGGRLRVRVQRKIPEGEAVSRVEAPRGELIHYVKSDGTEYPYRVKVRAPTLANLMAFPDAIRGAYIADIPSVMGSLDPCFSCTDRMAFIDTTNGNRWHWSLDEVNNSENRKALI